VWAPWCSYVGAPASCSRADSMRVCARALGCYGVGKVSGPAISSCFVATGSRRRTRLLSSVGYDKRETRERHPTSTCNTSEMTCAGV
jgi:hypothetical protein